MPARLLWPQLKQIKQPSLATTRALNAAIYFIPVTIRHCRRWWKTNFSRAHIFTFAQTSAFFMSEGDGILQLCFLHQVVFKFVLNLICNVFKDSRQIYLATYKFHSPPNMSIVGNFPSSTLQHCLTSNNASAVSNLERDYAIKLVVWLAAVNENAFVQARLI